MIHDHLGVWCFETNVEILMHFTDATVGGNDRKRELQLGSCARYADWTFGVECVDLVFEHLDSLVSLDLECGSQQTVFDAERLHSEV